MKASQKFFLMMLVCCIFTIGACSNEKKSSTSLRPKTQDSQKDPVCVGFKCLSSIDWKILLYGKNFPDKVRMDINGVTVLDECLGKQQYSIDRFSTPQSLFLEDYFVPRSEKIKIHVLDLGLDCSTEESFIYDEEVAFDVTKGDLGQELIITL